ncbi:MAG: AMP-binding protein [Proteobacteria bacterium]|nr:AMP-binding protein [Desulfobacteraceae bacterium]MBU3981737.1 AMP-binding protein [Pseudomonadota bacterium]MBU4014365.1 AMP-binding protein [Pseudomonadota bacterium]MBU4067590.1 AMP-binding protein [Pseudomonadota bacterium]MBU4102149.1 AMP-binding protein [Pseudomonadota bacterium]
MTEYKKSYFHSGGTVPLLGLTIPEYFTLVVKKFLEREAVVSIPQGKRLTYTALSESVDLLARGLVASGFGKGDRIGIWSTNNVEWLLLQMATARIGTILVTINPAYRLKELAYALSHSEVQGLFVVPSFRTSDYISMLVELIPELKSAKAGELKNHDLPLLRQVVLYDPVALMETRRSYPGFNTWSDILEQARSVSLKELDKITASLDIDDPINIQYTSGTTGHPKAVVLSHHNILNNAYFVGLAMHFTEKDRLCVPVPFYHCFGMVLANLLCLSHGACIVIACEHFDALEILRAIEAEKCTAIHGVPTMFIAEMEHQEFNNIDTSTLRTGIMAGAPCSPVLMNRVMQEMHCQEILIGYGETEASPITHLTCRDDSMERRIMTVGKNLPYQEAKVVDVDTGATLPIGQSGEICFRGYHIMKGYYGDPEATEEAIDKNGWLHSGDLGTMDADGYMRITGRLKEMIIRGGENIYPREIEDFIYSHPKVAVVAVFGVPDEYYGEEVMAWINLRTGETATGQEIREFCKSGLAHFKVPRHIWFVEEFPMTVTGKLQKFRMREIAIEQMTKEGHIS